MYPPVVDLAVAVPVEGVLLPAALRGGAGGGGGHLRDQTKVMGSGDMQRRKPDVLTIHSTMGVCRTPDTPKAKTMRCQTGFGKYKMHAELW